MWLALAWACGKEPDPADSGASPPDDSGTPPVPTGDTATTPPPPTPTGDTGPGTTPTGGPDPLLDGDQATLAAIVELAWGVSVPDQWFVSGMTFQPGSFAWEGATAVPLAGPDSCEVRVDDPDYDAAWEDFGALVLRSGAVAVDAANVSTGAYVGTVDLTEVDPRGLAWDVEFGGGYLPAFTAAAAVVFPVDQLGVDAPATDSVVDRALPLEIRWSGTPADHVQIDLIPEDEHEWVRCLAVDDGAYDIDPSVLGYLTAGRVEVTVARVASAGPPAGSSGAWVQVIARQSDERYVDLP